ncbi:MAG: methionyl-tRNA formyltransferase [Acidimicrobiia bacterium]|nr:methionyl-tRNA formyltransferase [Acidimicrobiia bacterium]
MTRAIFLGSPPAAVPSLAAALEIVDVVGVITQPDRPRGRSGDRVPTAVKVASRDWGLDVFEPDGAEILGIVEGLEPEVAIVVAYGRILKKEVLAVPEHGFVNVHFSLLPRWRGAAPVQAAIAAGDADTGVSLMRLDEGLDTGPVIASALTTIAPADTGGTLTGRLSSLGAGLLTATLPTYVAGEASLSPQDETAATHAPRMATSDARLDPTRRADELERAVRAFSPRPGAWLEAPDGRLKVHQAGAVDEASERGVVSVVDGRVLVGTAAGSLELHRVQASGKPPMAARSWMNGRRGEPLSVL